MLPQKISEISVLLMNSLKVIQFIPYMINGINLTEPTFFLVLLMNGEEEQLLNQLISEKF